jgi:hypothetical protein
VSAATFLAIRELRRKWGRAALAALVVAGAVALSAGLELMGRARERAVEVELDRAGPALRVLPPEVTVAQATALRFGGAVLPPDAARRAHDAGVRAGIRAVEQRAVLRDAESGRTVVVTTRERGVHELARGQAVLGSGLAERSGLVPGDAIRILGRALMVASVAPSMADASDFAVHVHPADAGDPAPSELRVYLEPGVRAADAERVLGQVLHDARVVRAERSAVADGELQGAISSHRLALQIVTAAVALLALAIATHLDVSERRKELALLAAIGASEAGLVALVVLRAITCAVAGAVAGVGAAVALVVSRPEFASSSVPSVAAAALLLTAALAAAAAAPIAIGAARRDPVQRLQEG